MTNNISPFSLILCFWGLAVALIDDSMMIAWAFFFLAMLNEILRLWAARVPKEYEKFE